MTAITKRVSRVTPAQYRGRAIVVTLTPEGLYLREKGRRLAYLYPYAAAFARAAQLHADAERRRKQAERKARNHSTTRSA